MTSEKVGIQFTLPEPPSANRWWRKWNNRMVLSVEARAYKLMVERRYTGTPFEGAVAVNICWYRKRRSGDLDKRLGVVLDALQGVAYVNDSQVVRLVAERYDDPKHPRLEVAVEAL